MKTDRSWLPGDVDLDWIESAAPTLHPVLLAMEAAAAPDGIPILDRASGRVLATLAVGRPRIVEIGTAIGYSTLCLALGQGAGTIVTIDPDVDRTTRARAFWRQAGIADHRIEVIAGHALAYSADASGTVASLKQPFVAIPYYAWANRGPGEMSVWLSDREETVRPLGSTKYPTPH